MTARRHHRSNLRGRRTKSNKGTKKTNRFFEKLLTDTTKLPKVALKPSLDKFVISLYDVLYRKNYSVYGSTVITTDVGYEEDYEEDIEEDEEEEEEDEEGDVPMRELPTSTTKIDAPTLISSASSPNIFWQTLSRWLPNAKYFFDSDVRTDAIYWVANCKMTRCLVLWWLAHNAGQDEKEEERSVHFTKEGTVCVRKTYPAESRRRPTPFTSANAREELLPVLPMVLFDNSLSPDMPDWIKGGRGAQVHVSTSTRYTTTNELLQDTCLELRLRPDVVGLSNHSNVDLAEFQRVSSIVKHVTVCQ